MKSVSTMVPTQAIPLQLLRIPAIGHTDEENVLSLMESWFYCATGRFFDMLLIGWCHTLKGKRSGFSLFSKASVSVKHSLTSARSAPRSLRPRNAGSRGS